MHATKTVFIAEKPSVARAFAGALNKNFRNADGYMESDDTIVTWCVGHLVSMSYPDAYDPALKKWSMGTIPFIPDSYRYQVIDGVKKQFNIVKRILTDPEVGTIYICTDSGREGEYIYRLVASQAGVKGKKELRVWIDSQTQEEILRGIREAKPSSAYDNLGSAAYLRAQEDYLMGINFSRALTLRYSDAMSRALGTDHTVIAVGRVMTCVLGMVVKREREIRSFVKTPFFRVQAVISQQIPGKVPEESSFIDPALALSAAEKSGAGQSRTQDSSADPYQTDSFTAQWQADEKSIFYGSPRLYKDSGFLKREDAEKLIQYLYGRVDAKEAAAGPTASKTDSKADPNTSTNTGFSQEAVESVIEKISRTKEKKNPPLLYNLAELQNDCSRFFKISPDQTLAVAQELYEKKLTTYPRTDARVLTTAVAKEIGKNLRGLSTIPMYRELLVPVLESGTWKKIGRSRYTDDKAVTDHYAIIPTGDGMKALPSLSKRSQDIYELIVRRFISIFYPPAVYERTAVSVRVRTELFTASLRVLKEKGYLQALDYSFLKNKNPLVKSEGTGIQRAEISTGNVLEGRAENSITDIQEGAGLQDNSGQGGRQGEKDGSASAAVPAFLKTARKGTKVFAGPFSIREGETAPPKRYTSGSMILAMENAGQLIEEEELREQIRGSGIGTSATRAEILKKLFNNDYLRLNKKTQVITPSQTGEMIYDTCSCALKPLLDPRLTASWELGLTQVASGTVTSEEYTQKLNSFITRRTNYIKETNFHGILIDQYKKDAALYPEKKAKTASKSRKGTGKKGEGTRRRASGGKSAKKS